LQRKATEKRKKLEEFIEILEDFAQLKDLYQNKMEKIIKNLISFNSEGLSY